MPFTFPLYTRAREATRSSLPAEFLFSLFEGGRRSGVGKNKATAKQSPLLRLLRRRVSFQTNVYASAIGLCKDFYHYAVNKTVEF